jgi:sugar phosphate isomerase/epimerase
MIQKMDTGIYTWFGFQYNFNTIIQLIKNAGYNYVMTWWGDEFIDTQGPKEKKPDIIRENGLKLENVHFPFAGINSIWENSLEGHELFQKFISYIDDCNTYEIPTAIMHVTSGNNPPPFNQLGLDRFKRIIEQAENKGVFIALENLRKPEYLEFIFNNIDSNNLKFCYDSGHQNCFTPDIDYLAKYGDKLIALHLHDNDGSSDQHLLPFNGSINWKNIMEKLRKINYKGSLALEVDTQYIDVSKEYSVEEYLSEGINRSYRLMNI